RPTRSHLLGVRRRRRLRDRRPARRHDGARYQHGGQRGRRDPAPDRAAARCRPGRRGVEAVGRLPAARQLAVEIGWGLLAVDQLAGPAGSLDPLARGGAEAVGVDREWLRQLAAAEDLDGDVLARAETRGLEGLERDRRTRVEAGLEI